MSLTRRRIAWAAGGVLLLAILFGRRKAPPPEPPAPFTVAAGVVMLPENSKFLARLEIVQAAAEAREQAAVRTVGQIIALSNASGALTGEEIGWVELDPGLSQAAGLRLSEIKAERSGIAFGMTSLPAEYAGKVHPGERIEISRYGLRGGNVAGAVYSVSPGAPAADSVDVVFRFSKAADWFPGTNCEIVFPVLTGRPVTIPTTAPVHEGAREYVWREAGAGRFEPRRVSVLEATPEQASVLGLSPGDRIVGRGAILLKPLLRPALGLSHD